MRNKTRTAVLLLAAAAVALAVFVALTVDFGGGPEAPADEPRRQSAGIAPVKAKAKPIAGRDQAAKASPGEDSVAAEEPSAKPSEGEAESADPEDVANRLVDQFDELTDKWMEPAKNGVSMKDVDAFVAKFKTVPKDRQDECLHRALNLIPDENVMLLAGILMDKSLGKENLETVFNDILNRDETVKEPILKMVFKDKTHPCWADTAWIMDVTKGGEAK